MQFISTRGGEKVSGAQAIAQGLAKNGGLFVPETFPNVSVAELNEMLEMDYPERTAKIIHKYLDDYDYSSLYEAIKKAYSTFEGTDPAPLVKIEDGLFILELFHGPTCAFKDMALTVLPYLLKKGCELSGVTDKVLILVATSGDTGKAALEGFKNAEGIDIMVLYPDDGVSKMQKLQMCTQEGDNVNVVAVKGNFDECQTSVKTIFTSDECKKALKEKGYILSSANSINFGRLVPQIAYYFSAYLDLVSSSQIAMGDKVDFTVPTGNFGNILAAYYAKQMGLPINKLVCASNKNNILTDFISNGVYDINRNFFKTMSPSMDILISSNLERLLFELSDRNSERVSELMQSLKDTGKYEISEKAQKLIKEQFVGGCTSEEDTVETIYDFFEENGYPMDTHTGVAMNVALSYINDKDEKDLTPMVVVSTASPYKFPQDVLYAITGNDVKDSFKAVKHLNIATAMQPPKNLMALRDKKVRFTASTVKEKVFDEVLNFINR